MNVPKDSLLSVYTPSQIPHELLEAILVKREPLLTELFQDVQRAITGERRHRLMYGPRGIGKTYLLTMLYHRVRQDDELNSRVRVAWLPEDMFGTHSMAVFYKKAAESLIEEYQNDPARPALRKALDDSLSMPGSRRADHLQEAIFDFVGDRLWVILVENLGRVFEAMKDKGQRDLRAMLQSHRNVLLIATATSRIQEVRRSAAPFFGFFAERRLDEFTAEEGLQLLKKVADIRQDQRLIDFLQTTAASSRAQAVYRLAGGTPRVWVVLSQFVTDERLDELVPVFEKTVDDLTPYYQHQMADLSPYEQEAMDYILKADSSVPVGTVASELGLDPRKASVFLNRLVEDGLLKKQQIGKNVLVEPREPIMATAIEIKESRGRSLRFLVKLLRAWFPQDELEQRGKLCKSPRIQALVQDALGMADGTVSFAPGNDETLRKEIAEFSLRDLERAYQASKMLMGSPNRNASDVYRHAVLATLTRRDEEARTTWEQAEQFPLKTASDWHVKGFALRYVFSNLTAAQAAYEKAIELDPNYVWAWYSKGVIHGSLGHNQEAIASYEKVLELDPNYALAWYGKGLALGNLGHNEEALVAFEKAIELDPNHALAWYSKGLARGNLGRNEEALVAFEKAIELDPNHALAWYSKGVIQGNLGHNEEALVAYEKAIELDPTFASPCNNKGVSLRNIGNHEEALAAYDKAIELDRNFSHPWNNKGVALENLGRNDEALAAFEKALELDPEEDTANRNRALLLVQVGELRRFSNPGPLRRALKYFSSPEQILGDAFEKALLGGLPSIEFKDFAADVFAATTEYIDDLSTALMKSTGTLFDDRVAIERGDAWVRAWEDAFESHFAPNAPKGKSLKEMPEPVQIALRFVRAALAWNTKPDPRQILDLPPVIQSLAKDVFPGANKLDEPDIPRKARRD